MARAGDRRIMMPLLGLAGTARIDAAQIVGRIARRRAQESLIHRLPSLESPDDRGKRDLLTRDLPRETEQPPGSRHPPQSGRSAAKRPRNITCTWPMRLMVNTPSMPSSTIRPGLPPTPRARRPLQGSRRVQGSRPATSRNPGAAQWRDGTSGRNPRYHHRADHDFRDCRRQCDRNPRRSAARDCRLRESGEQSPACPTNVALSPRGFNTPTESESATRVARLAIRPERSSSDPRGSTRFGMSPSPTGSASMTEPAVGCVVWTRWNDAAPD